MTKIFNMALLAKKIGKHSMGRVYWNILLAINITIILALRHGSMNELMKKEGIICIENFDVG